MDFFYASTRKARPWTEFTEKWPKIPKVWSYKELIDGRLGMNFRWFKGNYVLIVVIAVVCFTVFHSPFLGILGCIGECLEFCFCIYIVYVLEDDRRCCVRCVTMMLLFSCCFFQFWLLRMDARTVWTGFLGNIQTIRSLFNLLLAFVSWSP